LKHTMPYPNANVAAATIRLFDDTGIHIVARNTTLPISTTTAGWQQAYQTDGNNTVPLHWLQWQALEKQCFLAIDTTTGDIREGHLRPNAAATDSKVPIRQIVDKAGKPVVHFPEFVLHIEPNMGPRDVHLVVDFGNSRSGALLVEVDDQGKNLVMLPFEIDNLYSMRNWQDGKRKSDPRNRWFSSRTAWCQQRYLEPPRIRYVVPGRPVGVTREVRPTLFEDWSMARLGREATDILQLVGDPKLLAVSSPKRFLWAADTDWLGGRIWSMAEPYDVRPSGSRLYYQPLSGDLLSYIDANDDDAILKAASAAAFTRYPTPPLTQHVPRSFMVAALYEILAQAYAYVNSDTYLDNAGSRDRPRRIRTLALSYPSGMVYEERERYRLQASKAARIFSWTVGRGQSPPFKADVPEANAPEVAMTIDEASAAQLSYVWSALKKVGEDPEILSGVISRDHANDPGQNPEQENPSNNNAAQRNLKRLGRFACIDIGGGTTDIMIADYHFRWGGVARQVEYEILFRDGISRAGDYLTKLLLEDVIVPEFVRTVNIDPVTARILFGEETPANRPFRELRIQWLNRLWVPLAEAYLDCAAIGNATQAVSHFYHGAPPLVDSAIVESLEREIEERFGYHDLRVEMNLRFREDVFESLVTRCFGELLGQFCEKICDYHADLVLLAGQPTKLAAVQDLVRRLVPLAGSRIVPMHNHYAGAWYPYQDGSAPGIVTDPKSAVVVGTALKMASDRNVLGATKFMQASKITRNPSWRFYWGMLAPGKPAIHPRDVWFAPGPAKSTYTLEMDRRQVAIGRKLVPDPHAEAAPVYLLTAVAPKGSAEKSAVNIKVELERQMHPDARDEEILVIRGVSGYVAGENHPAVFGENVFLKLRTLGDEMLFLDTGALDNLFPHL
jgi:hypothetical protein